MYADIIIQEVMPQLCCTAYWQHTLNYQEHLGGGCNSHAQSSKNQNQLQSIELFMYKGKNTCNTQAQRQEISFSLCFDFVSLKDSKTLIQKHFFKRWEFVLDSNPVLTFIQQHGNEYILLLLSDIFRFTIYCPYFAISKYVK